MTQPNGAYSAYNGGTSAPMVGYGIVAGVFHDNQTAWSRRRFDACEGAMLPAKMTQIHQQER